MNEYQEEIKNITKQIVEKYKPEKIILYGSFAYGKPRDNSDLDLIIIKKTQKSRVERIKELLMKIKFNIPLDPLIYNPDEYNERVNSEDSFFKEIFSKGKVIYQK